jgi:hypothetical protein
MAKPTVPAATKKPTEDRDLDWMAPLGLAVLIGILAWRFVANKPFGLDNDNSVEAVAFFLAALTLVILGWGYQLVKEGRPQFRQVMRDRLLVVIGIGGFMGYFNFAHLHFGAFVHIWDTYHYVMGSKYFPEVGYDNLYDCATIANWENGRKDEVARQNLTDLRTNLIITADSIVAHPETCKASFSDARWAAFKTDIATFRAMVNEGRWREIHHDHGYNATPVWTLVGYALTNAIGPVSLERLKALNLLDPIYWFLTAIMIWWAFGPRGFAIACLVLGTHFPNRYYWTGGAFLRHDWIFFFVASICLLKKQKPGLAGAAFAYATLLRLFPGLMVFGPILAAAEYYRQHKKIDVEFKKWVVGGVIASVILVGASFAAFGGASTWMKFRDNTVKHANTPLTNHMGLRTVLSWRPYDVGSKTFHGGVIDPWHKWKEMRVENWHTAKPFFALLMLASLAVIYLAIRKTGTELWISAALATGLITYGAELTNYYYCFLLGMAVLHVLKREVGMIFAVLSMTTHFINWGPMQWMSHHLDEQYVAMAWANVIAVGFLWFLFTKLGHEASIEPEAPAKLSLE